MANGNCHSIFRATAARRFRSKTLDGLGCECGSYPSRNCHPLDRTRGFRSIAIGSMDPRASRLRFCERIGRLPLSQGFVEIPRKKTFRGDVRNESSPVFLNSKSSYTICLSNSDSSVPATENALADELSSEREKYTSERDTIDRRKKHPPGHEGSKLPLNVLEHHRTFDSSFK